ncbi:ABC transporter ATP-binding protein [Lutispora saccharofermentans]|uniref:ABC transporter ATP-binding protein n=1 Tax=Lutispora saccharofermentans TaxID=3024236 RepID=A0ABT1NEJ4_9FIRM|nr:ABC transporter ATP-binding protein [Lutispora saccharofermentans]MCQ1529667.1 ABC transporter ATP-binding protein [Lutispora saccharofermentans]
MAPILEIKGLRKDFKDFSLKGIDITMEKGYIMGFIGPNGAGKTTTIKLMMNLLKKDAGEIKIFGMDHLKHEKEIKNRIGFVFDENHFYEELMISEMKWVVAPFYETWDEKVFQKYIRDFQLPPKKKIKDLSKGMKMKFSLAIALSHKADLLVMDEPTSGLDPLVRSELLDILSETIQDENKAVFFSTHITSDLDKIADYVTLIDKGEIILSMEKDDLLNNYGLVKGSKELLNNNSRKDFISIRENQFGFEALVSDRKDTQKSYGDRLIIEKPNLEDIMLYYTRRCQNV